MIFIGVTYLDECVGSTTTTSSIRTGVHWVHTLQSTLESAAFEGFILLLFSKIFLPEDRLLILWFMALWICFNYDLGWLESVFMLVGAELFLLKGLKMPLSKLSVTSRKTTLFKVEAIWIRRPSNLNALIIFFRILEVLGSVTVRDEDNSIIPWVHRSCPLDFSPKHYDYRIE